MESDNLNLNNLLELDEFDENILNLLINNLSTSLSSHSPSNSNDPLLITQLLITHFYNSNPPSDTHFNQLLSLRLSRSDDSPLTHHLTILVIEMFNVESLSYSVDHGSSIAHLNHPDNIIDLHNSILQRVNDPSILLTWSYTLSKITHAIQSYSSPLPSSFSPLRDLLLPTHHPQPLYQLLYSHLLHPSFNLFQKLSSFSLSPTFQRPSTYNQLAYRSIFKGLLDATLSIVHPSFISDFDGLVNSFSSLLSSSSTPISAPLAHQFWLQYDSKLPASLIIDIARGRWPLDFFSLLNLLISLSGVSPSSTPTQDHQLLLQASHASERVFLYFSSLPSYTTLFDASSHNDESDPLIRIANHVSNLPGLHSPLPLHSIGRQLSPLNLQPPAVISWDVPVSGWNVVGTLLSDWLSARSNTRGSSTAPLFQQNDELYDTAVLSSLNLIGGVLSGNPDIAPLLVEHIGGSAERDSGRGEGLDLVAVLFATIDKCLSALPTVGRRNGNQANKQTLTNIVSASLDILSSLLQSYPGRVWTFLRGSTSLFTPSSPVVMHERTSGVYGMTLSLLRLLHALFTETQQSTLTSTPAFTRLKGGVLERAVAWSVADVYAVHASWRYVHLADKLAVGGILTRLYADIVADRITLPSLNNLVGKCLLKDANASTLTPIVGVVAGGADTVDRLAQAGRNQDAALAEDLLECTLRLAHILLVSEDEGEGESEGEVEVESEDTPRKPGSLLRRVFFDRSVARAAGASVRREEREKEKERGISGHTQTQELELELELVDMLAVYIASKHSTLAIRLQSTRLLTALCAYTLPSSSLAGFFADPHSTVRGLVDIVADPYADDQLRGHVWALCAAIVATQPGLATLLLTGQSVGAAARELIHERSRQSVAASTSAKDMENRDNTKDNLKLNLGEKELQKTALDIASENVEIWPQLYDAAPALLSAVLHFLDTVWLHLDGHLSAVAGLRSDERFWGQIGDVGEKDAGRVPPTHTHDTESLIDGDDGDTSAYTASTSATALSVAVAAYAHRRSASAAALSIISSDRRRVAGETAAGTGANASASAHCTARLAANLGQLVDAAMVNSFDTPLHSTTRSSIQLAFDGLDLSQYHNHLHTHMHTLTHTHNAVTHFGSEYVFNTALLKVKLDGFVASAGDPGDLDGDGAGEAAVDGDLVHATMEHIMQLNLDWSIVDAQIAFTRSVVGFVEKACASISVNDSNGSSGSDTPAALCAIRAAGEAASESRQGSVMVGVHAERLTLILKLLELGLKKRRGADTHTHADKFNPAQLIIDVERMVNLPSMPVVDSCRGNLTPPFHTQAMQIVFLTMHAAAQVDITKEKSRQVGSACRDLLATVITCMATSLEAAKDGGTTSSDEEFDLLVMTFMAIVKNPLAPNVAYWLPLLVEADVVRLSLDVFSKIPVNAAPQPTSDVAANAMAADAMDIMDEGIAEDDVDAQITSRPPFLQAVVDLHLILASFPPAAERLALDGLVAAYASSTLAGLAEQGAVLSCDPAYMATRNPWHTAWCRMLSVLTALIHVLGGSSQLIDVEIIGFIQLSGAQLAGVLSWNTETPFNLATVEELRLTVGLFASIANSEHYAQTTSYGHRSQPSKAVLHAFNLRAMHLLQQLTYGLTHPHLVLQLVEPLTAHERERLHGGEREFSDGLLDALVALTQDVLLGLTSSLDCLAVLTRQRPEWPAESYALVQPNANINMGEMASVGTLLDLASYCIDNLKSGQKESHGEETGRAKCVLEATLVLTATQMAMWTKVGGAGYSSLNRSSTPSSTSTSSSVTLKRDISGALAEDFNAVVDRSKSVLNATERRLPVIIGSFMERVVVNG
ncbi:hypothetical protein E3P91_03459 [Wallemia ichthyophaga]|nr:hypothetical protein E3P91_03459 [Wallemia ichthyophaga]